MTHCLISAHNQEALRQDGRILLFASKEGAEAMATAMQLDFVAVSIEDFDRQRKMLMDVSDILQNMFDRLMDHKLIDVEPEDPAMTNADGRQIL